MEQTQMTKTKSSKRMSSSSGHNQTEEFTTSSANTEASSFYAKIAADLAGRISSDEFHEGAKIFGRSTMAAEYNTSPETIRRALKLLADMKVVEIKPQSGTVVLSKDNAKRFLRNCETNRSTVALAKRLHDLKEQYDSLNDAMLDTLDALAHSKYFFTAATAPLPNYELQVPRNSHLIGHNIGSLRFWQSTGATIIAIRRGQNVMLSPGPYAELYNGDVIILVGTPGAIDRADAFIKQSDNSKNS